jgi:hypothetical protein
MLDTAAGTISYTLNGAPMGVAFQLHAHEQQQQQQQHKGKGKGKATAVDTTVETTVDATVDTTVSAAAYFPALSLEQGESVVINAGTIQLAAYIVQVCASIEHCSSCLKCLFRLQRAYARPFFLLRYTALYCAVHEQELVPNSTCSAHTSRGI